MDTITILSICTDTVRRLTLKYIDIYQQIKEKIQLDIFLEGQKIPSICSLAAEYECSIDTIK